MCGSRFESVTSELWQPGPLPVVPEAMRIVPASTAAASNSSSSRVAAAGVVAPHVPLVGAVDAREQRVERDLLQHEAAVVAAVVDVVQVPLAEVVVGPLAGRVIEVVRPRIERELLDQLRIEPGLVQDVGIGLARESPARAR